MPNTNKNRQEKKPAYKSIKRAFGKDHQRNYIRLNQGWRQSTPVIEGNTEEVVDLYSDV
jgi:hypothetical protein